MPDIECSDTVTPIIWAEPLEELIRRNMLTYLGPELKTFIALAHATSPDIALGNRFAHLNIIIQQGPITTSDHLPMYIRLATKPIATRRPKTWKIHKADWDKFSNYLNTNMHCIQSNENQQLTTQQIEAETRKWLNIMNKAMNIAIPMSDTTTMPYPKITSRQRQLMNRYKTLKRHINRYGWTLASRHLYKIT